MIIRPLVSSDVDRFAEHIVHHLAENGLGPRFAPFDELPRTMEQIRQRNLDGWAAKVGDTGWMRTWAAFDEDGAILGHADLRARGPDHTGHRALLGMGVRLPHRRRGLGTRLLETVTDWARAEGFAWVDLFVLEPNTPAQTLYRRFGFVEVCRYTDFFRIGDDSVGDIGMVLDLRG